MSHVIPPAALKPPTGDGILSRYCIVSAARILNCDSLITVPNLDLVLSTYLAQRSEMKLWMPGLMLQGPDLCDYCMSLQSNCVEWKME